MRATHVLPALAPLILAGCPAEREAAPSGDGCSVYAARPEVYAFCVRREAAHLDLAAAKARCDALPAGDAEECRKAWVEERIHAPNATPKQDLLTMCSGSHDCGFNVIELYPEADPIAQIAACKAVAGEFTADCVGHTLQRWQLSVPAEESVGPMIAATAEWPDRQGHFVGVLRYCQGKRVAPDAPSAAAKEAGCPDDALASQRCLEALKQSALMPTQCAQQAKPSEPPPPPPQERPPPPAWPPPPR